MLKRLSLALLLTVVGLFVLAGAVLAVPALPFSSYGIARLDGADVGAGTTVSAWCGGAQVRATAARVEAGASWYVNLDVPGDDVSTPAIREGCTVSETVTFQVGAAWSEQAIPWVSAGPALTLTASTAVRPAPVAPTVTPARVGGTVRLSWADLPEDRTYEVWRSTAPYFAPGAAGSTVITNAPATCTAAGGVFTCDDVGAAGDPAVNYFYVVRAGNATAAAADSSRVGAFTFGLAPGN